MNGNDIIDAVTMVDDDLLIEAAEYTGKKKNHTVHIIVAVAASAAVFAVVSNIAGSGNKPNDLEVDNNGYVMETTSETLAAVSETYQNDAVYYTSDTGVLNETEKAENDVISAYPETVTEEKSDNTVKPSTEKASVVTDGGQIQTEAPRTAEPIPFTEDHQMTEPEIPETSEDIPSPEPTPEITIPPRPTPSPMPQTSIPPRPTPSPGTLPPPPDPRPTPMPPDPAPSETEITESTTSPGPYILPVNRENNTYDQASYRGKSYTKRCVHVFDENLLDEKNILPFFESVSERTGVMTSAKTVTGISYEEMFLLKCGLDEGQYYVFLNDNLSDVRVKEIFEELGIIDYTEPDKTDISFETEQPIPTPVPTAVPEPSPTPAVTD